MNLRTPGLRAVQPGAAVIEAVIVVVTEAVIAAVTEVVIVAETEVEIVVEEVAASSRISPGRFGLSAKNQLLFL